MPPPLYLFPWPPRRSSSRTPFPRLKQVLDVIQEAYERGLTIGDLPSKADLVLPPLPSPGTAAAAAATSPDGGKSPEQWRERQQLLQRVKKRNAELFSLRCDVEIKLRIAEEFREHGFYFPYNLDFRGRCVACLPGSLTALSPCLPIVDVAVAHSPPLSPFLHNSAYPVPPNLNHLGSDLCRGMLAFAERKPLGPEGLDWLKIHLANLCGKDKVRKEKPKNRWTDGYIRGGCLGSIPCLWVY